MNEMTERIVLEAARAAIHAGNVGLFVAGADWTEAEARARSAIEALKAVINLIEQDRANKAIQKGTA